MAIFRCMNCGRYFHAEVRDRSDLRNVKCPSCGSSWVVYVRPGREGDVVAHKWGSASRCVRLTGIYGVA
ncbi:MAG: hypothetical protein DRO39_06945 [Thermoprotei archaeon]|nr:MAG: hypothetical protein DRO39_06945 [Thermoprotei archaeon]